MPSVSVEKTQVVFSPEGETNTEKTTVDGSTESTDAVNSSSTETELTELEPTQPEGVAPEGETKPGEGDTKEGEDDGKGLPPSVQTRIDKLTAEKYQAREQVEQLKAELAQAKQHVGQAPQVVSADTPLGDVQNHGDLSKVKEQALQAKEWALMNPNGGAFETTKDGKTETKEFSADEVREVLVKANRLLDRDIPGRKEYLDAAAGHFQVARTVYPNLFNADHPDSKLGNQFLNMAPWVKKFSDYPIVIGDYIAGARARLAREATAGKPSDGKAQPPANKAKVIGSPKGQAGPRTRTVVVNVGEMAKAGKSDLSVDDAANILDTFFG